MFAFLGFAICMPSATESIMRVSDTYSTLD